MESESLVTIGIAVSVLIAGNSILYLSYKRIFSRTRILPAVVLFVLSLLFGVTLLNGFGLDVLGTPGLLLLLTFVAFLLTQRRPVSKSALCRALAVVSAITAFLAAWNSDFTATAVSLGVTGALVHLADQKSPVS